MPSQTVAKKARTAAATKSVRSAPAPSESDFASTSALTRLLQILDLFSLERPTIRVEEVIETFSIVQSTAYRYLRELCDAGLLAQQGKGVYSLGRRIVELERLLLLSDPLLLAGKPVMDSLAARYDNRAFLLCAYYKDGALCVYKVGPDEIRYGGTSMKIQRGRGTLLPLFSGAGSHVILAHLPAHQIKSLYLTSARQISEARLGDSWHDFRDHLSGIRKRSFAETFGKLNPGMHSVAVPVIREDKRVVGSLLMLGPASKPQIAAALELVPLLQKKAAEIGRAIPAVETIGGE
jgi:DNA-binding IclR family transcriptional regulator